MVTKKKVDIKKNNTVLLIIGLVIVGFLLFSYTNVPTGKVSRVVVEKNLHTHLKAGMSTNYRGYIIKLIGITSNGDAIISLDNSEPQVAWWSGCEYDDQGTWIRSRKRGGLNVRVCATSYDMQEADLDFRL